MEVSAGIAVVRRRACPAKLPAPRTPYGVHAVSVGEVLAALPLAQELKRRYPQRRLIVSTTTTTGQKLARERMPFANAIFYFPLDWRGPVRRALKDSAAGCRDYRGNGNLAQFSP